MGSIPVRVTKTKGHPKGCPFVLPMRFAQEPTAQNAQIFLFAKFRARMGSHSPPGDLQARLQGVGRANPRQRRDSRGKRLVLFIQDRRAWYGINELCSLYGITACPCMDSADRLYSSFPFGLDSILALGEIPVFIRKAPLSRCFLNYLPSAAFAARASSISGFNLISSFSGF